MEHLGRKGFYYVVVPTPGFNLITLLFIIIPTYYVLLRSCALRPTRFFSSEFYRHSDSFVLTRSLSQQLPIPPPIGPPPSNNKQEDEPKPRFS